MYMKFISSLPAQVPATQRLPYRWRFQEFVSVAVGDGHVIYGFDVCRFAQVLHGGYEAFRSWVEEVFGEGAVVFFAPFFGDFVLFGGISCCFAEGD